MDLLVGLGVGVAASFLAWLISFRLIGPSVEISAEVSRLPPPENYGAGYLYRVKVRNRRRWRRVIDVDFKCALAISGIYPDRMDNRGVFPVPVDHLASPRLAPRSDRMAWIRIHQAERLRSRLPRDLQERFDSGMIRMEELLSLPDAELRFFVRGSDSFSGSPRLIERVFRSGSVVIGPYNKGSTGIAAERSQGREAHELLRDRSELSAGSAHEAATTEEPVPDPTKPG